jgi:gliding motility-associated-like protein
VLDTISIDNAEFQLSVCAEKSGNLEYISIEDANGCINSDLSTTTILVNEQESIVTVTLQGCQGDTIEYLGKKYFAESFEAFDTLLEMRFDGCDSFIFVQASFMDDIMHTVHDSICKGDSININGKYYFEGNLSGLDTIISIDKNICDSIIKIEVAVYPPPDTGRSTFAICYGDTLELEGVKYHSGHLEGFSTIEYGSTRGCDSTYKILVEFYAPADTGLQVYNLCKGDTLSINDVLYHTSKTEGFEILENKTYQGCDSIVKNQVIFFDPASVRQIDLQICPGDSIVFNGITYSLDHMTGLDTLLNGSYTGCDSIFQVALSFYDPPLIGSTEITLCQTETIEINGKVFGEANIVGFDTISSGSYLGCDSIYKIEILFHDPPIEFLRPEICRNQSIIINGKEYDLANSSGYDSIPEGSVYGCDSFVVVNVQFSDVKSGEYQQEICKDDLINIEGVVFDKDNLTESILIPGGSVTGCDSIVNVNILIREDNFIDFQAIICAGDSMRIGKSWYHDQNLAGTEVFEAMDSYGCDSIVNVQFEVEEFDVDFEFNSSLCDGLVNRYITFHSASGISNGFQYSLDGLTWIEILTLPYTLSDLPDSTLNLYLMNESGCLLEESLSFPNPIEKILDIGDDRVITLGDTVHLVLSDGFIDPLWNPDICLSEFCYEYTLLPEVTTIIDVIAYDVSGCLYKDEIQIIVENTPDFYLSNIFSPNFDALNDELIIHLGNSIVNMSQFQIFDRWGNLLQNVENQSGGTLKLWDGTFNNEIVAAGVYVYVFKLEYLNGRSVFYTGDVTLVR